jgi:hypothetical protein
MKNGYVYFIEAVGADRVKIGYSANTLPVRLNSIRTMSPIETRLLGYQKGSRQLESALHARFASARRIGEWFTITPEIQQYIEDYTTTDLSTLPPPHLKSVHFRLSPADIEMIKEVGATIGFDNTTVIRIAVRRLKEELSANGENPGTHPSPAIPAVRGGALDDRSDFELLRGDRENGRAEDRRQGACGPDSSSPASAEETQKEFW